MPEDTAIPEGGHGTDEQNEVPDQVHVDETHCSSLRVTVGSTVRGGFPHRELRTVDCALSCESDEERGAAIQAPGLFACVVVFRPLFAVAHGREAVRVDAAAHE